MPNPEKPKGKVKHKRFKYDARYVATVPTPVGFPRNFRPALEVPTVQKRGKTPLLVAFAFLFLVGLLIVNFSAAETLLLGGGAVSVAAAAAWFWRWLHAPGPPAKKFEFRGTVTDAWFIGSSVFASEYDGSKDAIWAADATTYAGMVFHIELNAPIPETPYVELVNIWWRDGFVAGLSKGDVVDVRGWGIFFDDMVLSMSKTTVIEKVRPKSEEFGRR